LVDLCNKYKHINTNGDIKIGNDVWIGDNVTILSGVEIGDGAVIGINSLVTKNVPSYAIVGGVPAKIIKYRFDKQRIQNLEEKKWFDLEFSQILNNINKLLSEEKL
jgi:acetyltransferase-like isoleucine patch superfamily enzyme